MLITSEHVYPTQTFTDTKHVLNKLRVMVESYDVRDIEDFLRYIDNYKRKQTGKRIKVNIQQRARDMLNEIHTKTGTELAYQMKMLVDSIAEKHMQKLLDDYKEGK